MTEKLDYIARFAKTKNFDLRPRTVFVEGTTDVDLFQLAARLERERTGFDLLGEDLAIIAAGEGNEGGARGICRELVSFKNMAGGCLLPGGRPKYRFIGLFDNDDAGRRAIYDVRKTDTSILEYKDVFRLRPVMPLCPNRDPAALRESFKSENGKYRDIDWELEDLLPEEILKAFLDEHPDAVIRSSVAHDKIHRDWTRDGKARLHYFVRQYAICADLVAVVGVLRALRHYLGLQYPEKTELL